MDAEKKSAAMETINKHLGDDFEEFMKMYES